VIKKDNDNGQTSNELIPLEKPCPLHDDYSLVRAGYFDLVTNETIRRKFPQA